MKINILEGTMIENRIFGPTLSIVIQPTLIKNSGTHQSNKKNPRVLKEFHMSHHVHSELFIVSNYTTRNSPIENENISLTESDREGEIIKITKIFL